MRVLATRASAGMRWRQRPPVPIRPMLIRSPAPTGWAEAGSVRAEVAATAGEGFRKERRGGGGGGGERGGEGAGLAGAGCQLGVAARLAPANAEHRFPDLAAQLGPRHVQRNLPRGQLTGDHGPDLANRVFQAAGMFD